jgi:formamidopyrimidine-DNA glycosylase
MPELPEVETLCRQLNAVLPGEEILQIEIFDSRLGKIEGLVGRRIEAVTRRGKYIQIQMSGSVTVALHLRMSGRLLYLAANGLPPLLSHRRLAFYFPSGTLFLIDPRRFATFTVQRQGITPALPDDPMAGLPVRRLRELARRRRLPVKSFLMDQRLIAGIGNIYACEILFAAGVDPCRPASSLTTVEWRKVSKAAAAILRRAVACRGTTVSDWRDLYGCRGTNQDHLEVYSRQGAPCRHCGGSITRIIQSGRGTWFCPLCQK